MYKCSRCGSILPQSVECSCPPEHIQKAAEILDKKAREALKPRHNLEDAKLPEATKIYRTIAKALRGEE